MQDVGLLSYQSTVPLFVEQLRVAIRGLVEWVWMILRFSQEVHSGILEDGRREGISVVWVSSQIMSRLASFNFSLPLVDSLTPEDTGLCFEFLEGFRLGLYMFMNYKTIQQSTAIYQVRLHLSVNGDESRQAVASDLQGEGRDHRFGEEEPGDDHHRRHGLREEHAGAAVPDRSRLEPYRVHTAPSPVHDLSERARGEGDVLRGDGRRGFVRR